MIKEDLKYSEIEEFIKSFEKDNKRSSNVYNFENFLKNKDKISFCFLNKSKLNDDMLKKLSIIYPKVNFETNDLENCDFIVGNNLSVETYTYFEVDETLAKKLNCSKFITSSEIICDRLNKCSHSQINLNVRNKSTIENLTGIKDFQFIEMGYYFVNMDGDKVYTYYKENGLEILKKSDKQHLTKFVKTIQDHFKNFKVFIFFKNPKLSVEESEKYKHKFLNLSYFKEYEIQSNNHILNKKIENDFDLQNIYDLILSKDEANVELGKTLLKGLKNVNFRKDLKPFINSFLNRFKGVLKYTVSVNSLLNYQKNLRILQKYDIMFNEFEKCCSYRDVMKIAFDFVPKEQLGDFKSFCRIKLHEWSETLI